MPIPAFITALRRHIGTAPLWLSGVDGVVVRDTEQGREVLLIERADFGHWSDIGGIVEPGEGLAECLLREIAEEAGVVAEIERLVAIVPGPQFSYPNGDVCQFLEHTFLCRWISGEPHADGDETMNARWFLEHELPPVAPKITQQLMRALGPDTLPYIV
ncbi:MAG: NUDIX domain-containing protein [Propionibacteriaceae bacterium]